MEINVKLASYQMLVFQYFNYDFIIYT